MIFFFFYDKCTFVLTAVIFLFSLSMKIEKGQMTET